MAIDAQLTLRKRDGDEYIVLGTRDLTSDSIYGTSTVRFLHSIRFVKTAEGRKITATTTRPGVNAAAIVLEGTDATPFSNGGKIYIVHDYNGANAAIYKFKANSLVSADEMTTEKPTLYTSVEIEKDFTSADTRDSLSNEGITLSGAPTGFDDTNGIYWTSGGNRTLTYTNANAVSKSYKIEAKIYRNNNNVKAYFTSDGTNYYEIYIGSGYYYRLSKKVNGTVYVLQQHTIDYTQSGRSGNRDLVITVDKLVDGSVKIGSTWSSTTKIIDYTDTADDVGFDGLDNGAPITSGQMVSIEQGYANAVRFLEFKLTSYDTSWPEEIINKTFTDEDNASSLSNLGITTSAGATYDATKGICWSSKENRYVYYTNDSAFRGSYSFTIKGGRDDSGDAKVRFAKDGSNYYEFVSPYGGAAGNPQYFQLNKVYNGTTYNLYTSSGIAGYTECGRNTYFEATVNVTEQADGSLKINILWSTAGVLRQNITYVDSLTDTSLVDGAATDNGAPITSGTGCHIYQGWAAAYVNCFKLVKYNSSKWYDSNNKPLFVGRFFDSTGSALSKPVNGIVYFDYPTSRLGTYKVIAALYENNEMTAITVLDPEAIYGTKAKLFTVNDAENAKIKVFFVDSEEKLNNITEVYELN